MGAAVTTWLQARVAKLAKGDREAIEAVFTEAGTCVKLGGTRACCRCHFVKADPHGRPRVDALIQRLLDQIVDYCVPRSTVTEALQQAQKAGSAAPVVALDREARRLFTKLKTSGEGGELLLYLLLENVLDLPQLLCKMPLKTSSDMHVHGVDGVHGKLLDSGTLALYWGESKLYADVNAAIDACFESLAPYLLDPGGGPAERDLLLTRTYVDPDDETVKAALARYFDVSTPEASRVEYRGACLVGFDYDEYPGPEIRNEVLERVKQWHERIGDRVSAQKLESFHLEVFCVPMPSVQQFRDALRDGLGL